MITSILKGLVMQQVLHVGSVLRCYFFKSLLIAPSIYAGSPQVASQPGLAFNSGYAGHRVGARCTGAERSWSDITLENVQ